MKPETLAAIVQAAKPSACQSVAGQALRVHMLQDAVRAARAKVRDELKATDDWAHATTLAAAIREQTKESREEVASFKKTARESIADGEASRHLEDWKAKLQEARTKLNGELEDDATRQALMPFMGAFEFTVKK
jgi:hypothetical protein